MASRMDRYRNDAGRSVKNQDIYKQMEDLGTYTNIEGIANIEGANEVNISKIKEMLKNRENYQKEKRYRELLNNEEKRENLQKEIEEIEKKYDIKDVLSDALKTRNIKENDNHKFELSKYDILKEIDKNKSENLKEMIENIATNKKEADMGLFEDLKSDGQEEDKTIKQIINEAKEETEEEMDKSFFTSSLSLTSDDFEDLKEMHTDLKRNNKLLKIFSILFGVIFVGIVLLLIFK